MKTLEIARKGLCIAVSLVFGITQAATPEGNAESGPPGSAWADWFVPGKPRVIETDIQVERWSATDQFVAEWLDDRRIAFSEVIDPTLYSTHNIHYMPRENLRIVFYDTKTGAKEVYGKGQLYCLKNGRIVYGVLPDNSVRPGEPGIPRAIYAGKLGEEQPRQIGREEWLNRWDCEISPIIPGTRYGNPVRYLKREHGYIDTGFLNESRKRLARYIRADGKVIELPFKGKNLGGPIRWLEYLGGYQLPTGPEGPPGSDDYQATNYLLKPDGSLRKFPVSTNRTGRIQARINYLPVRTGALTFMQTPVAGGRMHGASGIYYDDGKTLTRVHGAFVSLSYHSLSPDGCKLPFASMGTLTFSYKSPAYLTILDVCGGEG